MKTLNVSWKTDEPVPIEIRADPQKLPGNCDKQVIRPPSSSRNLIVITCSGGVLRHWPRS
jgi:hypothetical protein